MFRRIIGLTTRLGVKGQSDIENWGCGPGPQTLNWFEIFIQDSAGLLREGASRVL